MSAAQQLNSTTAKQDWSAFGWSYLFFWYFSGIHHVLLQLAGATIFSGIRQATIVSTLWLIPLLLFPNRSRQISAVIGIILYLFSLVSLGYFSIYRQEFSQSVIFIIFESNAAEASEYIAQYFVWWMIPAVLIYSAGAYFLWCRIRPLYLSRRTAWALVALIMLVLFVYPNFKQLRHMEFSSAQAAENIERRMEPAVPWQIIFGYTQYLRQLAGMQELLDRNNSIPPLNKLKDANAGLPATLVLVIGESTNKQHMSLYGYARATTPRLDALRKELAVFTQVVAPRPYTIETLQQVLTFADQENPDLYLTQPSLMNMMKQAGYKTFWITNQQTMTKRNTMLTNFSQQMDEQIYLNNSRAQNSREYDSNVLAPFNKILMNDPAERKFIVVHLLGTHMKYDYRYPPEYEVFKDRQGLPDWVTDDQLPIINSYDNAVLFNDFVVSSLIGAMVSSQANGFLVYFSDHGEDVFDSPGHTVLGRNEGKPTPPMYTVPFIVWSSEKWRATHPRNFAGQLGRRYGTSHFIHTWADLAEISFDGFDPSKSLVGKDFKERPLLVGDPGSQKTLIDLRTLMSDNR